MALCGARGVSSPIEPCHHSVDSLVDRDLRLPSEELPGAINTISLFLLDRHSDPGGIFPIFGFKVGLARLEQDLNDAVLGRVGT